MCSPAGERFEFDDLQVGDLALLNLIRLWLCDTLSRGGERRGERSCIHERKIDCCGLVTRAKHAPLYVSQLK